MVTVRLTRKFARTLDGVDVSRVRVGQKMTLSQQAASLLVAEGWADPLDIVKPVNRNGNGNGNQLASVPKPTPKRRRRRMRAKKIGG